MSFFEKNTEILCRRFPSFKSEILDRYIPDKKLVVTESRSGFPTASIEGRYIHSRHDPVREAVKLVDSGLPGDTASVIIEGFGLGYHAEELIRRYPDIPVVIVEPSETRFISALKTRDMERIFSAPELSLVIGLKPEALRSLLPVLPKGKIHILKNRTVFEIEEEYFRETERIIKIFSARREVNTATLKKFGRLWVKNLFSNLPPIAEAGDVGDLAGIFGDIPVILLAAGPSLDSLLPVYNEVQKRFVTVAVDTSAAALSAAGYYSDFTVVVDPQYWNTRHLDRLDLKRTILISESSTHPVIFRKEFRRLYLSGSIFPLGIYLENLGGGRKRLGAGGSVATTAWDFCRLISQGDVYCAGLDLGFPENKTHFRGSFFEEKVHTEEYRLTPAEDFAYRYIISGEPVYRKNNEGGETLTDNRLGVYRQWFEEQIKINDIRKIWNTSKKGIKIEGMDFTQPEVLLSYPEVRDRIDSIKNNLPAESPRETEQSWLKLAEGILTLEKELEQLSLLSGEGIELIKSYNSDTEFPNDINILNCKLSHIDQALMNTGSRGITSFLLQPVIEEVERAQGKASKESAEEVLAMSFSLYSKIRESAEFHLKEIRNSGSHKPENS